MSGLKFPKGEKKKKRMSSWVESVVDWHFVWQVTCSRSEYSTQR